MFRLLKAQLRWAWEWQWIRFGWTHKVMNVFCTRLGFFTSSQPNAIYRDCTFKVSVKRVKEKENPEHCERKKSDRHRRARDRETVRKHKQQQTQTLIWFKHCTSFWLAFLRPLVNARVCICGSANSNFISSSVIFLFDIRPFSYALAKHVRVSSCTLF